MEIKNLSFINGKLMEECGLVLQSNGLAIIIPSKSKPWRRPPEGDLDLGADIIGDRKVVERMPTKCFF